MLTLIQTHKAQRVPVLLYGRDYWQRTINFDTMCEVGTITPEDRALFQYVDSPAQAWEAIQAFYKETS
jgi:predicted Rossmann-fold nucleotide-binding protein